MRLWIEDDGDECATLQHTERQVRSGPGRYNQLDAVHQHVVVQLHSELARLPKLVVKERGGVRFEGECGGAGRGATTRHRRRRADTRDETGGLHVQRVQLRQLVLVLHDGQREQRARRCHPQLAAGGLGGDVDVYARATHSHLDDRTTRLPGCDLYCGDELQRIRYQVKVVCQQLHIVLGLFYVRDEVKGIN